MAIRTLPSSSTFGDPTFFGFCDMVRDPDTSPKCFTASSMNIGFGSHRPGSLPLSRWFYIDLFGSSEERPLLLAKAAIICAPFLTGEI